jgi:hypothetical protein
MVLAKRGVILVENKMTNKIKFDEWDGIHVS